MNQKGVVYKGHSRAILLAIIASLAIALFSVQGCSSKRESAKPSDVYKYGWPQPLHDQGQSSRTSSEIPTNMVLKWSLTNANRGNPPPCEVTSDRAFLTLLSMKEAGIVAYNLADGKPAWREVSEAKEVHFPALTQYGLVYVFGPDRETNSRPVVVSLDPATGAQQWKRNINAILLATANRAYLLFNHTVEILDARDGHAVRKTQLKTDKHFNETEKRATDGDSIYLEFGDQFGSRIESYDLMSGKLKWRFRFPAEMNGSTRVLMTGTPGSVIAYLDAAEPGYGQRSPGSWKHYIVSLDKTTGKVEWQYTSISDLSNNPVLADGTLVLVEAALKSGVDINPETQLYTMTVKSVDLASGAPLTRASMEYSISDTVLNSGISSISAGDSLVFIAGNGDLIQFSMISNTVVGSYNVPGILHGLAAGYGRLLVTSHMPTHSAYGTRISCFAAE